MNLWLILFLGSGTLLLLLFLRRLSKTRKDIALQKELAEQEAAQMELEAPLETPEEVPAENNLRRLQNEGAHYMRSRRYDDAERVYLMVLELKPGHEDAHLNLGGIYMKLERYPEAEFHFSELLNQRHDPVYFSNLGAALYQQQRLREAAAAYENAIALDDRRAARLRSLGQVYHELGEHDRALHYFERAAKRTPKDHDLKALLVDYYERMERYPEAISALKGLLEEDPKNKDIKARMNDLKTRIKDS